MSNFLEWWDTLNFSLKIYWAIAIPFTFFFIIQLLFSFLGGEVPDDSPNPDIEIEEDQGIPFQFFSVKNLVAFFTIFGWVGIASIDSGLSEGLSLMIATAAGLAMMLIMASLFYFLSRATEDGTMKFQRAVGGVGEVYLPIKSKRGGIGKVQITVQGSLRTLEAITDDDEDIPTGKLITVREIVSNSLLLVTAK